MTISEGIEHDLLEIEAVQLRPDNYFTWTSGIRSPIYCDNRLIMSYPEVRNKVIEAFVKIMEEKQFKPDVIAGCATAGIPHAAWLSERLNLPMAYVRSKPKGHGKGNQIEGIIQPGQKVLVIEDLISTGGSSIESAKAIESAGGEVISVLAIFSYGLKQAKENFKNADFNFTTITNFDKLLEALMETQQMTIEEKNTMTSWRDQLVF
ncbi:orotate phosphoribosyltransferase [Oceanobacillus sp. CAU 1775]